MAETAVESISAATVATGEEKPKLASQLLIVVGEPFSEAHRGAVLQRLTTELSAWDSASSGCDLNAVLNSLAGKQPEVSAGVKGECILEWKSDAVNIEVLINPRLPTAVGKICQLFSANTAYRCLVYSGHAVAGSGSWLLQDGPFQFSTVAEIWRKGSAGSGPIDLKAFGEGEWTPGSVSRLDKRFRLNHPAESGSNDGIGKFVESLATHVTALTSSDLLPGTDVIGFVPFHRPTMYVFQGGDGMSSIFGIRGFTLLVDGGYNRRTCFWEFARHLDRIDSMVVSHLGVDNTLGMTTFINRLAREGVQTSLGQVFFNAGGKATENGKSDSLLLSLAEEGSAMVEKLHRLKVPVVSCTATPTAAQPTNLYFKIGFGSLDMYVLTPMVDSKELKEFITNWGGKSPSGHGNRLGEHVSVGFVVVFKPATASRAERPVRVLFPGVAPLPKIFEGLDRLKAISLFQTSDGLDKPAPAKAAEKPPVGRPVTAPSAHGKPADAKPATTPREVSSAKLEPKKPAAASQPAKEVKKAAPAADVKKMTESKPPTKATTHSNGERKKTTPAPAAESKDTKAGVTTSTPKKDAPKPAPPKVELSGKNGAASAHGKKTEEPAKKEKTVPKSAGSGPGAGSKPVVKKVATKPDAAAKNAEHSAPPAEKVEMPVTAVELAAEKPADSEPTVGDIVPDLAAGDGEPSPSGETAVVADADPASDGCLDGPEPSAITAEAAVDADIKDGGKTLASEDEFNPTKSWDIPQSLPAPADKDGEALVESAAPAPVVDNLPTAEQTPAEPVSTEQPTSKAAPKEKSSAASKRPTTDRLNQTVAGKGGSETARSANGKTSRLSLQPKVKSAAEPSAAKAEPVQKTAASHSVPAKKAAAPTKPVTPFYVDLAYVPADAGNVYTVEYFQRVRARNYVFCGAVTDPRVLALLVDAKSSWEGDVTVIPTGDTDMLIACLDQDRLRELKITVAPSVNRSSLQLENGSTCTAYRLEF